MYETLGTLEVFERSAQEVVFTGIVNQAGAAMSAANLTTLTLAIYSATGKQFLAPRSVLSGLSNGTLTTTLTPDDVDLTAGRGTEERVLVLAATWGDGLESHMPFTLRVLAVPGA